MRRRNSRNKTTGLRMSDVPRPQHPVFIRPKRVFGKTYNIQMVDAPPAVYNNKEEDYSTYNTAKTRAASYEDDTGRKGVIYKKKEGTYNMFGIYSERRRYMVYYL
jgi:hypothetical protein